MELFKIIQPHYLLAPYVKHHWILETTKEMQEGERVIPTGSVQLIFHKADRMFSSTKSDLQPQSFICGQSIGYSDLKLTGTVRMIVTVFHPNGAKPFFKIPINQFCNFDISVNDLEEISLKELNAKVLDAETNEESINHIEEYLISKLYLSDTFDHKRISAAIQLVNKNTAPNIHLLADACCLSEKQFNRKFSEYVGINPKKFLRIVRFQRALYKLHLNPRDNLAQLASECGFYDQPHMTKEFNTFSGYSPIEYLQACAPYSDYFS